MNYSLIDIKRWVGKVYYSRGLEYRNRGLVKLVSFVDGKLFGVVMGSVEYKQEIDISNNAINGKCTCPVAYNCKHVAAVLLQSLVMKNNNPSSNSFQKLSYETEKWLEMFDVLNQNKSKQNDKEILYLLDFDQAKRLLSVNPVVMKLKKDGTWSGNYQHYNPSNTTRDNPANFLKEEDVIILRDIANNIYQFSLNEYRELEDMRGRHILEKILASKRCYWQRPSDKIMNFAQKRHGKISWNLNSHGNQQLIIQCPDYPIDGFFVLDGVYYIDIANNSLGLIETDLGENLTTFFASCPLIKEDEVLKVRSFIENNINQEIVSKIDLPYATENVVVEKSIPEVCLKIYNLSINKSYGSRDKIIIPALDLYFRYHQTDVWYKDYLSIITTKKNGEIIKIRRDKDYESGVRNILTLCGVSTVKNLHHNYYFYKRTQENSSIEPCIFLDKENPKEVLNEVITEQWTSFLTKEILDFKKRKWHIEIAPDFLIDVIYPSDEWYGNISNTSSGDWFDMDIGIYIDGQKTSLIPILVNLLKRRKDIFTEIVQMSDDQYLAVNMNSGKILQLPVGRIRDIILFLQNFLDAKYDNNGIKISRFSASFVADLAACEEATKLRFFGEKKLLEIGEKLKDFRNIPEIKHPKNFVAKLRNYQHEGLNWLQFLREYSLAGILADDMGLGKTIQTLAHIQCEKENKRLNKPVLIIAPTSVVHNWCEEITKVTPKLNILVLHGSMRKNDLSNINNKDVIITSYPLLRFDQELLLSIKYHSVILDEAQYIKNSKAKVTLIANQLRAENRLCLTGTPIENHLGELWSIFNFLMPGYLGSEKTFNILFRNPIEKENNQEQKAILAKRVKLFLLRRTKDKILQELPKKTEIIRNIELSSKQRDLYETVRALTFKEIKNEIENKGFARSQIKILEALLRLRQICCDPRISKLKNAKNFSSSAKMEYLMEEMLPTLLEEGHSILLFSQFVSVLDLIEPECKKRKIKYVRLTGDTKDRKTPIKQFQEGKAQLFLISLKAGGVGLNLTKADTIIHYDPWWNPAVENQATDRAHRIGQKKPVFVYKLIVSNTVEEKIVIMQNKKKDLADKLFDPNNRCSSKITMEDLQDIFQNPLSH
jgi:superfamily II DNA or RNA helicase